MRRLGLVLIGAAVMVGLGGCDFAVTEPDPPVAAVLRVSILSDGRTAVLDARGSVGEELRFFWDLGAGMFEGDPVVQQNFGIGVFPVRLKVVGRGKAVPGGGGEAGGPPGGAADGVEFVEAWTYGVVDTAMKNTPTAIVFIHDVGGNHGPAFWSGTLTFNGSQSRGISTLIYRWEIVRVDNNGNPTPYRWATEPEYIVSDKPIFKAWLPGPTCEDGEPDAYRYRVKLAVRDENWQEGETVVHIEVR